MYLKNEFKLFCVGVEEIFSIHKYSISTHSAILKRIFGLCIDKQSLDFFVIYLFYF